MTVSLYGTQYLISETDSRLLKPARAEVAFVGRSNSGKSSMINAVCRQTKLARVSQTPGRTRTINVYQAAHGVWLVDLPGYGYASGPLSSRQGWKEMIETYLTGRPSLRRVFMLVDAKVGATPLDLDMAFWLSAHQIPFQVLANKADQVKSSKRPMQHDLIARSLQKPKEEISWISTTEGTGINALRQQITQILSDGTP